jgi:hypothetical protein
MASGRHEPLRAPRGSTLTNSPPPQKHIAPGGPVRRPVVLFVALLVCGCSPRADQVWIAPGLVAGSSGAQPGYAIKLVRAKEAPSTAWETMVRCVG